jgi:hypothetical protein
MLADPWTGLITPANTRVAACSMEMPDANCGMRHGHLPRISGSKEIGCHLAPYLE